MTSLEKHRETYLTLPKKDLHKIVAECLDRNTKKIDNAKSQYKIEKSIRNNNRRSLRKFLKLRHSGDQKVLVKIKQKIKILKGLKND